MPSTLGPRKARNVKLPIPLDERVQAWAAQRGVSVIAAITILLGEALDAPSTTNPGRN